MSDISTRLMATIDRLERELKAATARAEKAERERAQSIAECDAMQKDARDYIALADERDRIAKERDEALSTLWAIGLSPQHHQTLAAAASGAASIVASLREHLHNPPPDVQDRVMAITGVADRIAELIRERDEARAALQAVRDWYDRDGSVGGCDLMMEEHVEKYTKGDGR